MFVAALVVALGARVAAASDLVSGVPSVNRAPSPGTLACAPAGPPSAACLASAVADIDAARTAEGVGPITLPNGFGGLAPAVQLLALTDLERVDRGLSPVLGLTAGLDAPAQVGADSSSDPAGPVGFLWGSSWSSTSSALLNSFGWMYDDGPGSPNIDCPQPGAPGCWGHRLVILHPFADPIFMGAAAGSTGQAELLVGGYKPGLPGGSDAAIAPLWSSVAATIPLGFAPAAVTLTGGATVGAVAVWASGAPMDGRFATAGGWSVSPAECNLPPGNACALTLTAPAGPAPSTASLSLSGPTGVSTIALTRTVPVALVARATSGPVRAHARATVLGAARPAAAGSRLRLELLRAGVWHLAARGMLDARGRYVFHFHPPSPGAHRYRVRKPASGGYEDAVSPTVTLRVTAH